jgi:tetratricopeptide (TPR) repeat protein
MNDNGDVSQSISGHHNTQINSGNDTIAAIGQGSMAAGRDIIIENVHPKEMLDLQEQIDVLSNLISDWMNESNSNKKMKLGQRAVDTSINLQNNKSVVFSPWKLLELSEVSMYAGQLFISEGQVLEAKNKFSRGNNRKGIAAALLRLGAIYDKQLKLEEAMDAYQNSLVIFREVADKNGQGCCLNQIGIIHGKMNQVEQAKICFGQSIDISVGLNDLAGVLASKTNLANILQRQDLIESKKIYQELIEVHERENFDFSERIHVLGNLGNIEFKLGNYQQARDIHELVLKNCVMEGDRLGEAHSLNALGQVAMNTDNFTTAHTLLTKAIEIEEDFRNPNAISGIYMLLSKNYSRQGELLDSEKMALTALEIRKTLGDERLISQTLGTLGNIQSNQGKINLARRYYKESILHAKKAGDKKLEETSLDNLLRLED